MAISAAMPNIETIAWCDKISVDTHFFRVIAHAPIKHLKLSGVALERVYLMEPPLTPAVTELQSLDIDVHLGLDQGGIEDENFSMQRDISPFFKSLLLRRAPTLTWHSMHDFAGDQTISLGEARLSFPRLRPQLAPDCSIFLIVCSFPHRSGNWPCRHLTTVGRPSRNFSLPASQCAVLRPW